MSAELANRNEELPTYSLSHYFPPFVRYLFPIILVCTMGVLVFSNLHEAEYVEVQIRPSYNTYQKLAELNKIDNSTSIIDFFQTEIEQMTYFIPFLKPMIKNVDIEWDAEIKKSIFTITIVSSIKDFWDSSAYELAIIIAAASLIWPYVKILLLIYVWLKPMHQNTRTKIILFLDQMGKWSYMDLYASVIVTVTFYVHATFYFNDLFVDIKIVAEVSSGIVTFVIVNLISMSYSTAFIFWDQHYGYVHHVENWHMSQALLKAEQKKLKNILKNKNNGSHPALTPVRETSLASPKSIPNQVPNNNSSDDEDEFWKSDIGLPMHSDMEPPKYKITGTYKSFVRGHIHLWRNNEKFEIFAGLYRPQSQFGIIAFSLFLCGNVLLLWLILDTVYTCPARFNIEGAVGFFIDDNIRCYDPITTANKLITSTDEVAYATFLSVCYWITIIVMPIVTQIVIILLWIFPMKHFVFVFLLKSLWFVQAWNALDVFFVGTMAGALQIDVVSSWIVDSQLPNICGANGVLEHCFIVEGTVTRGCWMAGIAAVYQWFTIYFTLTLAKDIGVHGIEY